MTIKHLSPVGSWAKKTGKLDVWVVLEDTLLNPLWVCENSKDGVFMAILVEESLEL